MWTALAFGILMVYILNLRRQINEVGEEVSRLYKDFMAEVYTRYGENSDGKK